MPSAPAAIEKALEIALRAHRGQRDKAGAPYILHPLRLMLAVEDEDQRLAALLHDVVEDGGVTLEDLSREGFSPTVVAAVEALTKREGEDYAAFIERILPNPVARRVKIADLEDNLDVRRLPDLTVADFERIRKYLLAWHRLRGTDPCA